MPLKNLRIFGKSEQNGVPSPDNPIPIVSVGENGNIYTEICGSNLCIGNLKAFFGGNENNRYIQVDGNAEMFYFKSKKGVTYTFRTEAKTNRSTIGYTKNEPNDRMSVSNLSSNIEKTFVAKEDGYCCIYVNDTRDDSIAKTFRINQGNIALPYEPYKKPQKFILSTPNGLPGIKVNSGGNYTDENGQQWICDEINSTERIQRIGRIDSYNNEPIDTEYVSSTGELSVGANVIYVLKEPIKTPLSEEEKLSIKKLHTNHPTTLISNDENADMELTYTVDTKSYVDGKIATLSKAIL